MENLSSTAGNAIDFSCSMADFLVLCPYRTLFQKCGMLKTFSRYIVFSLVFAFLTVIFRFTFQPDTQSIENPLIRTGRISSGFDGVTIKAQHFPLSHLLQRIEVQSGINFKIPRALLSDPVSVDF